MKYLLFILLLFVSCEKEDIKPPQCKECTYIENNEPVKVFVCGDELAKFESDGYPCVKGNVKN